MADADEFRRISGVLSEHTADADIRGIELRLGNGGSRIITVQTRTVGRLIGRHGTTADALRAALVECFDDEQLQLNIMEIPEDPPPDRRPPNSPGLMFPPA